MAGSVDTGWETLPEEFPWPPPNVQVLSPLFIGAIDIRWDDPSQLNTGPRSILVQATGCLIVTGTPAVLATATGIITVDSTPATAGTVLSIGGLSLTATAGPRTPGANDYDASLGTTSLIAQDISDAINDAANTLNTIASASALGNVVTLVSVVTGAAGNAVVFLTNTPEMTLSGAGTFTGGVDADTITLGGIGVLTAVTGVVVPGSQTFSIDGNTFNIADSIAAAINDPENCFGAIATATAEYGKVTLTAVPPGTQGNAVYVETTSSVITVVNDTLVGGSGIPNCNGRSNTQWGIIGVNIYRSDNGERGPYIRINKFPVGNLCYRDYTDNCLVEQEIVPWEGGWISKGDTSNDRSWRLQTRMCPIVKQSGQAISANSPSDVIVSIDGQVVPVSDLFGVTGEITLINRPVFDLATQKRIPAILPNPDGSSEVLVTYWYNKNLVKTDLDHDTNVFYRLTSVALDPSTPSGLRETPLGYSPPVSLMQVETFDYIWREAVKRNNWILEQGGERVKLFKKRIMGLKCPCRINERSIEYSHQPDIRCKACFGTGIVGGYDGPIDIIIAPDDAPRAVTQTPIGRHLEHQYEVWTGPNPTITQRDFIVKQTGERYSVGPIRRPSSRGLPLQQHFDIAYLDEQDIRYCVPADGLKELPWPQTRFTKPEDAVCVESEPYPTGFDYQASPMATEVGKIPVSREIRGRTPVWANLTYGGNGDG